MIRSLLTLALLLVAGILVYNYFYGTEEEKASSEKIFQEVKDLGRATWDLLKSEKEKLDEGKYDQVLDKVGGIFDSIREKASEIDSREIEEQVKALERKRDELQQKLKEEGGKVSADTEKIKEEIRQLLKETEALMNKTEKEG
ncbi:MAG: hypothetical protein R3350_08690 [Saprospiraceae bacterium]|nr:hypothetical protein [Saprospiraceae bacterium]